MWLLSVLIKYIYLPHTSDNEGHQTRLSNLKNAGDLPKPRGHLRTRNTLRQQNATPSFRRLRTATANCFTSVGPSVCPHRTQLPPDKFSDFYDNLLTKSKFLKSDKRDDITYEHRHIFLTTSGTHVSRVANIPGAATSHTLLMLLARCRKANAPKVFCASDISYPARFQASAAM